VRFVLGVFGLILPLPVFFGAFSVMGHFLSLAMPGAFRAALKH
jgi:hypothetical protein